MSDRVLKVACFSLWSALILLIITIPLIAMLWISGIKYTSRFDVILFIIFITLLDIIAEIITEIVVVGFSHHFLWTKKKTLIFRYILDFFISLMITHFVDEWLKSVSLSVGGEVLFAILILLFTAALEMNTTEEDA